MEVPNKTSVVKTNPNSPQGVIGFAPELISFIQSGKKTLTYRLGDKYSYLKPGDQIELREYGTEGLVSKAEVRVVKELSFAELPVEVEGHESYRDKEHQREVFNGYYKYTGRTVQDDDLFLMIGFEVG